MIGVIKGKTRSLDNAHMKMWQPTKILVPKSAKVGKASLREAPMNFMLGPS